MRVRRLENKNVEVEILSPSTEIQWNAEDNSGQVVFRCEQYTFIDGQLVSRAPAEPLIVPLSAIFGRVFESIAGPIPAEIVMLGIKSAFDTLWNEKNAEVAP